MGHHYKIKMVLVTAVLDEEPPERIRTPIDARKVSKAIFSKLHADVEHMVVLALAEDKTLIAAKVIATGTRDVVRFVARDVIYAAAQTSAHGIILVHNHASRRTTLSSKDRKVDRAIRKLTDKLDIRFHDHIIYTPLPPLRIREWTSREAIKLRVMIKRNMDPRRIAKRLRRSLRDIENKAAELSMLLPGQKKYE